MRAWVRIAPWAVSTVLSVAEARAEPAEWITVHAPKGCEASSAELAERVREALVSGPAPELRASVVIEPLDSGFEVTLETLRGSQKLGTKILRVPSCAEGVDAAVVVLALALSEKDDSERATLDDEVEAAESAPNDRSAVASAPPPTNARFDSGPPASDREDRLGDRSSRRDDTENAFRTSFFTGVDVGTLPVATAQIGLGFARSFGRTALRGTARYGLPHEEEELDTGRSERHRDEFGALELDACYGVGRGFTLAGCGGGEIAVVLSENELKNDAGVAVDNAARPRLAGVVTALVAHRGGTIQPELELSSAVVLAGREADDAWVAVRAAVGVAMQF